MNVADYNDNGDSSISEGIGMMLDSGIVDDADLIEGV